MTAMRDALPILLLACASAFGQLQTDTITITANRQVSLQPDQIVFGVQVVAPESAGIDDVVAQVAGVGISAANLTGVSSYFNGGLAWNFTLAVPISQASATIASLAQLSQQSKQAVTFYVQGTQVSQAFQQSQTCSQASLISDAQAQAQKLAAAAGFTVGPVLAVSDGSLAPAAPAGIAIIGRFLAVSGFLGLVSNVVPASPITCTAVVKFQLLRYH